MNKRIISLILVVVLMFPQAMAGATEEVPDSEVSIEETVEMPEGEAPIEPKPEPTEISEELHSDQLAETAEQTRTVVASGTCGDNLTWTLYDDGELYIAGSGSMTDYSYGADTKSPWYADDCRSQIATVTIEQGVTSIGDYAFEDCSSLTSITIPEGVTGIGSCVFQDCSSLTSITIPEGVTSIDFSTFSGCSSLISITIPEGVTDIGSYAFKDCSLLMSITIPEGVTRIGVYAFEDCSSLTSITIPEGVTDISSYAFRYCGSLASITIPKSVTSIGSATFYGCSNLQDVFFVGTEADRRAISINSSNSSNTTLLNAEWHYINSGDEVFTISVEQPINGTVTLSKTMCVAGMEITVGARPNAGYRLRTIIVDNEPIEGTSFTAGGNHIVTAEFEPYRTEGIADSGTCGTNVTWTLYDDGELYVAGLGEMGNWRPRPSPSSQIKTVEIEHGVTSIGNGVFEYCDSLTSITIPESVTSIGSSAFKGCSSLTNITIPASVTSIGGSAFGFDYYHGSPSLKTALETAEFMGNAPILGNKAFSYSEAGKFIIRYHSGTSGWTSPQWNGYYTECIDEPPTEFSTLDSENRNSQGILFTLNDTSNTATVGDNSTTENNSGYYGNNGGSIVIPAAVTKDGKQYNVIGIGQQAFTGNILLNTIELGSKITSVDPTAFSNCPDFTAFTVDPKNTYYSVDGGVLYDKNMYNLYCYPDGKTGATYQVPDTVNVIGRSVFSNNKYLTEIIVPDNVMSIGQEAFGSCENLTSITLPFVGTSMNANSRFSAVFSYIPRSLKTVTITGGKLKEYSFYYNVYTDGSHQYLSAEEISLPAGLTEIPNYCFQGCNKLSVIRFGDQEVEPGRLVLPEGITTIGYHAFWSCDSLTSVYISESVTSVGSEAFYNCPNCAEFAVDPNNKNYCSDKWGVLYNKSMTSLINYPAARKWPYYNISDSTVRIESNAFFRCANLKNLYIPNSVVSMSGCISSCPGMTVCAYLDSTAYRYAGNNSLDVWPMDNYRLQGIEIYSLPEQVTFLQGTEDFNGLYVVANGGKALQLDDYTISYDPKKVGTQEAVISYQGESVSFNITLYGADDHLIDFGQQNVSETDILFAAVYDTSGQMISVEMGALVNGAVQLVVPDEVYQKMGEAKLFALDGTTYEPTGVIVTRSE